MKASERAVLLVAILFSGAASLMYQVAWARRLASVTTATTTANAIVLALFMAGLGLGAAVAGRWTARVRRPALGYAMVEVAAALLALASFPWIEGATVVRAELTSSLGAAVATALQIAVAIVPLLLATTLLGASLPLLIEHVERVAGAGDRGRRGRLVATLYGSNTLGAALGSLLSGFVTIERLGLSATGGAGAAIAVVASALVVLGTRGAPPAPSRSGDRPVQGSLEVPVVAAAAVSGFVGLGAEVLWIRLYALIVPNTVYAYSQVVVAVLAGIVLGAALAGFGARWSSRRADPVASLRVLSTLVAALSALCLALVPYAVSVLATDAERQKAFASGTSILAAVSLLAALVPSAAFTASLLPLLVTLSRRARGAGAFGAVYAANTAGAVLGSLAIGLVALPRLGWHLANDVVEAAAVVVTLILALGLRRPSLIATTLVATGGVVVALDLGQDVPEEVIASRLPDGVVLRELREGRASHVMVTDDPRTGRRRLWINSVWVAGVGGPHRVFGHLPALLVEEPRRAVGIALGTGQSFAAVLEHGVERLDCVEIDADVIALSRRWFREANGGLLDDRRVRVHQDDGRAFLRATKERYDLVVLEPLQAWSAGTSNLYSRQFYEEARAVLRPGGAVSQWIPFYGQGVDDTRAMVRTALEVFPEATLWLAGRDGVLILSDEPADLSPATLQRRVTARGLGAAIQAFPANDAGDLLAFLLAGRPGLEAWTEGAEVIVDDRPFLEFRAAGQLGRGRGRFVQLLRSLRPHLDDPTALLAGAGPAQRRHAAAAGRVRDAVLAAQLIDPSDPERRARVLEAVPRADRHVALWASAYRAVMAAWLQRAEARRGDRAMIDAIRARAEHHLSAAAEPSSRSTRDDSD